MMNEAKKASKIESRLNILLGGYQVCYLGTQRAMIIVDMWWRMSPTEPGFHAEQANRGHVQIGGQSAQRVRVLPRAGCKRKGGPVRTIGGMHGDGRAEKREKNGAKD